MEALDVVIVFVFGFTLGGLIGNLIGWDSCYTQLQELDLLAKDLE